MGRKDKKVGEKDLSAKKVFSRLGMGLFLMMIAIFVGQVLLSIVIGFIIPESLENSLSIILLSILTVVFFGFPVFYKVTEGIPDSEKGEVVKISFKSFIGVFLVGFAFFFISNLLGAKINTEIARLKGETDFYNPVELIMDGKNILFTSLYVVIIGPIIEELVFRKIMLDKTRRFGELPAIMISSIAFGLYHLNLSQFFYAFALGLVLAYITLKTNTVFYAVILHMLYNLRSTIMVPFMDNNLAIAIIVILNILAAIVGAIIFIVKSKDLKFETAKEPVEKKSAFVLNLGSILYIGLCVSTIIYYVLYGTV